MNKKNTRNSNADQIDVLVSIVGFNPVSCLYAAQALRPKQMLLVHTNQTRYQTDILSEQLKRIKIEPKTLEVKLPASVDALLPAMAKTIHALPSGTICLDITGGTKSMMIALWLTLQFYRPNFRSVHLSQDDGLLYWTREGGPVFSRSIDISPKAIFGKDNSKDCQDNFKKGTLYHYIFLKIGQIYISHPMPKLCLSPALLNICHRAFVGMSRKLRSQLIFLISLRMFG